MRLILKVEELKLFLSVWLKLLKLINKPNQILQEFWWGRF